MADAIPILLDTDIGSDIDDAVALAYLLRQNRCDLLGITTVTGDVAQRAACAEMLCNEMGRGDIPIHLGASTPLVYGPGQALAPHYAAIQHRPHRMDRPPSTAVDFLRKTIRNRPGEITLLTIGPLTNIALLFALDPEIPSLLKQHVLMAGVFWWKECKAEWNCRVDPIATEMVYNARPPISISYGLDVTMKCQMKAPLVREKFKARPLNVVMEMAEVWFAKHADATITFHDPLAAAGIFEPGLCDYVDGQIEVADDPDPTWCGRTIMTHEGEPGATHRAARSVDVEAFFNEYFRVFAD